MRRISIAILAVITFSSPASAQPAPFPKSFRTQEITANGATIHVRVGGEGPAVVLLHGYGETGDMWSPLAADLARDHPSSCPTCAVSAFRPNPPAGSTRRLRLVTSRACSTRSESTAWTSSRTNRQHGGLRVRGAAPRARHVLRAHGCARSRCRSVGRNPQEPAPVALPLRRSRHGAPGRRTRADLPRPFLERVFRGPEAVHAKGRATTTRNSMRSRAPCMRASRSSRRSIRTPSTTSAFLEQAASLTMPMLAVGGEKSFGTMRRPSCASPPTT